MEIIVLVETRNYKKITLEVESSDTIENVKAKIHDKEGIPPAHQSLSFRGMQLEECTATLEEYGIDNNYFPLCLHNAMRIFVKMCCGQLKTITLAVEPCDTIKNVRAKIQEQESLVHFDLPHMKVFLETVSGESIPYMVEASDTIGDLKARILEDRISPDHQRLTFYGKLLEDGATLADYNIEHESTLFYFVRRYSIFVDDISGSRLDQLKVESSDTIGDVKVRLEARLGIPSCFMHGFIYNNEKVEDMERTVEHYNIRMGTTLYVVLREPTDSMGTRFKLEVEKTDTIGDVKAMVQDQLGIPSDVQNYC